MERPVKHRQRVEAFVSDRALAVICWLVVAFHLIFTVLGAIPGLAYTPRHKAAWLICVAALLALALWQETRNRAHHGHWLLLMPVLSAAVLRLFIPADDMGLWQCGLALVVLILGGALFARAGAGRGFRLAAGILCATVLVPTLMMLLLTAFIGPPNITLRRYPDPTGHLEAEVRVVDEGATGGKHDGHGLPGLALRSAGRCQGENHPGLDRPRRAGGGVDRRGHDLDQRQDVALEG